MLKVQSNRCASWLSALMISACGLFGASTQVQAVELADLYVAQIGVNSQSQSERNQALQEALKQTLVKVSGSDAVLTHERVKAALQNVNELLAQYSYRTENDQLQLSASFDENKLDALLRSADAVIWGNRRPQLMLWMATEAVGGERTIVSSDNEAVMTQQLHNRARERGVPIRLPLMDLRDTMAVSIPDIWGRFNRPLTLAGERYDADGIVSARVYVDTTDADQQWVVDWNLVLGNERFQGQERAADQAFLLTPMIDEIAEQLATRFGVRAGEQETSEVVIRVVNLESLTAVLEVEAFLSSLTVINDVELIEFGQSHAEFRLSFQGEPRRARQTIALDRRMQPVEQGPFAVQAAIPEYQWISR